MPTSILLFVAKVLAHYFDNDVIIKSVQVGDHEIKTVNFADETTIFLGDVNCVDRIQHILKIYEKDSRSKW